MWFLILLLILLFLLCLVLFVPVSLYVSYSDEVRLSASVLGIRIRILPKAKNRPSLRKFSWKRHQKRLRDDDERKRKNRLKEIEREKKKQIKKLAKKKEKGKKDAASQTAVKDESSMVSLLLSVVGGILEKFCGMLRVKVVRLHITVGGSDAAQTAITYGIVSQGVSYLLELLSLKTDYSAGKNESILITPDFLAKETTADISLVFTLRPWHAVNILCTSAYRFIKEKIRRESVQI